MTGFAIATAVRNVAAARAAGETRETTTLATDDEWRIVLAMEVGRDTIATAVRNVAAARAAGETRETTTLATDDEWRIVLAMEVGRDTIATAVRNVAAARAAGETRETTTLATDDEWRIVLAREAACARKWGPGREANGIPASAKGLGVNRAQWVFNVWVPRLKKSVTVCRWHMLEEALMWYEQNANKVFAKALSERITVEELKQFACAL